jgi:hypothetical protein
LRKIPFVLKRHVFLLQHMKNLKAIIFVLAFSGIGFSGCVKSTSSKYTNESLDLQFKPNLNGTSTLQWSLVNDKELLHYEIFSAPNDTFSVYNSPQHIIGNVVDRNITTFDLSDAEIKVDTVAHPSTHYYKVAAAFKDRKIVSKTLQGPNAYLVAMASGSIILSFNKHNTIYLRSNTNTTKAETHSFNLESRTFKRKINWPFTRSVSLGGLQQLYSLGTTNTGQLQILEQTSNPLNFIRCYNPDDGAYIREIPLAGIPVVFSSKMVNGIVYVIGQANSGQAPYYLFAIDANTGTTITSFLLTSSSFTNRLEVSNDGKTICVFPSQFNIGNCTVYHFENDTFSYAGILNSNASSSLFEDVSMSDNGNIIIRAAARKIYDRNGNKLADIDLTTGNSPRAFILQDNLRFIYFDGFTGFSLRNCADGSVIKEIGIPTHQKNLSSIVPLVINDRLYISSTFQPTAGNFVTVIKDVPF